MNRWTFLIISATLALATFFWGWTQAVKPATAHRSVHQKMAEQILSPGEFSD